MPDNSIPAPKETICYEEFGNLYLNITNQCSARCVFCIRYFADGVYGYNLRLSREPSEEEILAELERLDLGRYREVVFTGFGEPTCRFDSLLHITKWLSEKCVFVRLDTNGHAALLNPGRDVVEELKAAGMKAVSVSLNAESEEKYNQLCRPSLNGSYKAMLNFTRDAVAAGLQTRMTVVGRQDIDIGKCKKIAAEIGSSFRVR
ncbi:radical SAM protein, TatD family-associated [Syntrophus gentianae]|uniref:Radical SAM protein, TatD family-associated n=1 Tax=Syntrophus gentianae TaxID=43775 RepID=A0A1H7WU67_9BACT|nr:TatD family nuclease-associated radical SAM protein [Syntrophus gentianae]SEM25062.1 radical SAM protein, TatD family-associated [Syntrophus gentianae]